MKNRLAAVFLSVLLASPMVRADEMRTFLLSCAYGTLIGAGIGLATVAVSDDPSSHTDNIAKGASLGLYAGIGLGLYLDYGRGNSSSGSSDLTLKNSSPVWIQADSSQGQIKGASVHWMSYQF